MASKKVSGIYSRLQVGPMKRLYKYYTPQSINLAGGVPMDSTFPIKKLQIELSSLNNNLSNNNSNNNSSNNNNSNSNNSNNNNIIQLQQGNNLSLNYLRGDGIPSLRDWIKNHVMKIHNPIDNNNQNNLSVSTCMTIGSTDALSKTLLLLNGDSVLFDEYAYGTAVSTCKSYGRHCVGVKMDNYGMIPEDLRLQTILARQKGLDPDVVYLVPTSQNPTGVSMSQSRKQEIYQVCQELDLTILEDDAYYYLYHNNQPVNENININASSMPGIYNLPKSFLSMDVDSRVIRMDSLSKFICPGMRLGWISGPSPFIEKYMLLQEISSQFPSGLSQSVFNAIVSHWGDDHLHSHVQQIQLHYLNQRNFMCSALDSALTPLNSLISSTSSTPLFSYSIPDGGMFIFLKFSLEHLGNISSEDLFKKLAAVGVIVVPGDDFHVDRLNNENEMKKDVVIRLTYAAAQPQQIHDGIYRLAQGIEEILKQKQLQQK